MVVLPHQGVRVAEIDGAVARYAARDGAELNDLYVRPAHQGRGVGSALLRAAMVASAGELRLWTFQRIDGAGNEGREPDVRYRWNRPSSA